MIALAFLAMATAHACPVEHATYVLRSNHKITAHFETAPVNDDWQQGVVVAIDGANTGGTSYWLPWYGGTDDGRHIRGTALLDPSKDVETQRRVERRSDMDFFVLDRNYRFLPSLPQRGSQAPAHLLIPDIDSPRAFFDLMGCHRSTSGDRGQNAILPHIA